LPLASRDFARPSAGGITILVRTDAATDALSAIQNEIAFVDPNLNVFHVQTLGAYLDRSRSALRFSIQTYGGIGVFGLMLAAIGLAGVTGYAVAQRRKEIAIRTALGASKTQVLALVLREGAALVGVGTVLGFLGAVALAKIVSTLANMLVDALRVGTTDVRLLVGTPLLLAAVAMLACYVPARKAAQMDALKALREAPMVEEDYRGPVLFSNDAASDILDSMIGENVLGIRPKPGASARTTGEFSSNYKGRVLPAFLSVVDDPTMKTFQGKTLVGSYEIDEEGVRVAPLPVIKDGMLVQYLLGREPIRDFGDSNGHGRAAPGQAPSPSIGNLMLRAKDSSSPDELKKKLIDMCKQENKPYGYYAETLVGNNPRLLYRVYVSDGHQELVRGAVFDELDTRTLRNDLVAAGNDALVSNREGAVPTTVVSPSILFDELEVKRTDKKNAKLPEYPPPDLASH